MTKQDILKEHLTGHYVFTHGIPQEEVDNFKKAMLEAMDKYAKQQVNNVVLDLVSDCEIDNLLSDLDKDATDYNGYEYGLPICGEWLVTLRTTVRTWLNK